MAHTITGSPVFSDPISVADDGEIADAVQVETVFQALADRTEFLRQKTPGAAATQTLRVPLLPAKGLVTGTSSFAFNAGFTPYWYQPAVNTTPATADRGELWAELPFIPSAAECSEVRVTIDGDGAGSNHSGNLPTVLPELDVFTFNISTGVLTNVGNAVAVGPIAVYEANQDLVVTPATAIDLADTNLRAFIRLRGEGGIDAAPGTLGVLDAKIVVSPA